MNRENTFRIDNKNANNEPMFRRRTSTPDPASMLCYRMSLMKVLTIDELAYERFYVNLQHPPVRSRVRGVDPPGIVCGHFVKNSMKATPKNKGVVATATNNSQHKLTDQINSFKSNVIRIVNRTFGKFKKHRNSCVSNDCEYCAIDRNDAGLGTKHYDNDIVRNT